MTGSFDTWGWMRPGSPLNRHPGQPGHKPAGASPGVLRKRVVDSRRAAERAGEDLRAAEDRAAVAAEALRTAKEALAEARQRAREAEAAHRRAQRALDSR